MIKETAYYSCGIHPSLKLLSNALISSALVAFAIAALILAFSSAVINLPALPPPGPAEDEALRGSSMIDAAAAFAALVVTVLAS
jgi:hypothetical protein